MVEAPLHQSRSAVLLVAQGPRERHAPDVNGVPGNRAPVDVATVAFLLAPMPEATTLVRDARTTAGLSLRALAERQVPSSRASSTPGRTPDGAAALTGRVCAPSSTTWHSTRSRRRRLGKATCSRRQLVNATGPDRTTWIPSPRAWNHGFRRVLMVRTGSIQATRTIREGLRSAQRLRRRRRHHRRFRWSSASRELSPREDST